MNKKNILNYFIALALILVLSFLFLITFYGFLFKLDQISDSLFVVSIVTFVIALILKTGATRSLMSMNYTFLTIFKRKQTKEKYETFRDYYDENNLKHIKQTGYILLASLTVIVAAIILSIIYVYK